MLCAYVIIILPSVIITCRYACAWVCAIAETYSRVV